MAALALASASARAAQLWTPEKMAAPPDGIPADAEAITTDGGLFKRVLVAGDAAEGVPFSGAVVQVHYVGTLLADGCQIRVPI